MSVSERHLNQSPDNRSVHTATLCWLRTTLCTHRSSVPNSLCTVPYSCQHSMLISKYSLLRRMSFTSPNSGCIHYLVFKQQRQGQITLKVMEGWISTYGHISFWPDKLSNDCPYELCSGGSNWRRPMTRLLRLTPLCGQWKVTLVQAVPANNLTAQCRVKSGSTKCCKCKCLSTSK